MTEDSRNDERQACKIHVRHGFQKDCQWCWKSHLRLGRITEEAQKKINRLMKRKKK